VTECYRTRRGSRPARRPSGGFPEQVPLCSGGAIELKDAVRYIVNAGAIGQPRDGNPAASFGVWRLEDRVIELRRVAYDIGGAQAKMMAAGLPEYLAERLAEGR
jgi:diadenosine tetraphosphatase ApaH/serine/threonine PP2A family protein phosphatase